MHWSTGNKTGEEGQQVGGDMGFESKGRLLRKQSLGEVGLKMMMMMMMGLVGKMSTPAVVVVAVGVGGCNCCSYCFFCCC